MGAIIAIGGGELGDGGTLDIDREIVSLTGKKEPTALFIPTASEDSESYIENFHSIYSDELGCDTRVLKLVSEDLGDEHIREKIENADLVYVGGGNTRMMMNLWREKGVDKYLERAYENGTVMSGLSAGAICWFEKGHSDSERYETDGDWGFIEVDGLSLVEDTVFCPHYHEEEREDSFKQMMTGHPDKQGLAVDNNAAVQIVDGELEILRSKEDSKAYRVKVEDGEVQIKEFD